MFQPTRAGTDLPPKASSILATFIHRPEGLSFLFTRRPKNLTSFAGNLSFPGGRIEPTDPTPLDAALRETNEEIGLEREQVQVLGYLTELHTHFGTLVVCYAGLVEPRDVPTKAASALEVDEILEVPIASLLRPGERIDAPDTPAIYLANRYESRRLGTPSAPGRTLHYWILENRRTTEPTVLWGLTAEIVARVLRDGYGWRPSGSPRLVKTIEEFEP